MTLLESSKIRFLIVAAATASFGLWSCGKTKLNYDGQRPPDDSSYHSSTDSLPTYSALNSVKVRKGALVLVENTIAKAGFLNYSLYEDGTIAYEGAVKFLGLPNFNDPSQYLYSLATNGLEQTEAFKGAISIAPEILASKTYSGQKVTLIQNNVQLKMVDTDGSVRTIQANFLPTVDRNYKTSGSPTDFGAVANIHITISDPLIDITDATVSLKVFGMPLTLLAKKYVPTAQ